MLRKLDEYFLDHFPGFQSLSETFQKWTGVSCFTLGRFLLVIGVGMSIGEQSLPLFRGGEINLTGTDYFLLIMPFCFASVYIIESYRNESNVKRGNHLNPMRNDPTDMFIRSLNLLLTLPLVVNCVTGVGCLHFVSMLLISCGLYVLSCTPLPPAPSKLSKWLQKGKLAKA